MRAWKWHEWLGAIAIIVVLAWLFLAGNPKKPSLPASIPERTPSQPLPESPAKPTAGEQLLDGYGDPATPPIEDLRKIHRVTTGYFSVVKDASKNPIGGNADLAAALRGENPNKEIFVRAGNPVFGADGQLIDRWGTPLIVHPEGWKQLELRSAGPDKEAYTDDDLILAPTGLQK